MRSSASALKSGVVSLATLFSFVTICVSSPNNLALDSNSGFICSDTNERI